MHHQRLMAVCSWCVKRTLRCYDVNANHDDGFQSWPINDDPPRERVVLRGNTFINYEDPNQPFRGTLQGIGCFDGF